MSTRTRRQTRERAGDGGDHPSLSETDADEQPRRRAPAGQRQFTNAVEDGEASQPEQPPEARQPASSFLPVGTRGEGGLYDPPPFASRALTAVRTATVLENHQSPFLGRH